MSGLHATSSCALDRCKLEPSNLSRPACLLRRDRCKTKWQLAGLLVSYRTLARCLRPHWSSSPAPAAKQWRGVLGAKTRQVKKSCRQSHCPSSESSAGPLLARVGQHAFSVAQLEGLARTTALRVFSLQRANKSSPESAPPSNHCSRCVARPPERASARSRSSSPPSCRWRRMRGPTPLNSRVSHCGS